MIGLNFKIFVSTFLVSMALAFVLFAIIPNGNMLLLAKLIALSLGITLSSPFWYPHIRGVKEGDTVIVQNPSPFIKLKGRYGIAQENGRIGNCIAIMTEDGKEIKCEIVSYAGTFSKAKVKVKDDAQVVEVR